MSTLALHGAAPAVTLPQPHFPWPIITRETEEAVIRQLRTSISIYDRSGIIEKLESEFARRHSCPYALATSSGTAALHSAFFAIGIGPRSRVLCPNYTFLATVTPLMSLGAQPIFCDSGADGNVTAKEIEKHAADRDIAAVVITHMWGLPCDMPSIKAYCTDHNIPLIEDCSHAHGATTAGQPVGTFGDISVWSLQGQKTVTGGEGGVLLTPHRELYERAVLLGHYNKRSYQDIPANSDLAPFRLTGFGLKLRAHPIAMAIAHQQLQHLDEWLAQRALYASSIIQLLKRYPFARPPDLTDKTSSWYRLSFTVNPAVVDSKRVIEALHAEGASGFENLGSTRPLSEQRLFQEPWRAFKWYRSEDYEPPDPAAFPVSNAYYEYSIRLPIASLPTEGALMSQYLHALEKVLDSIQEGALQ